MAKTGASAPDSAVCSMTWGSASADRSIIALQPLLRTPVPRPTRQGTRPPGHSRRRSSEHRELCSTGTRSGDLFGGRKARFHRGTATGTLRSAARTTSPGQGTRRSSEQRAPHSTGARQPALFGAPRARPHRNREPDLFGGAAPHSTGTGNRTSSEARHPISTRPMPTASLARNPGPRGTTTGALRSTARTASTESSKRSSSEHREPGSTGQGTRRSSEHRAPHPTGTGNPELFGASSPPLHRNREPNLFGGAAPHSTGTGNRTSSEVRHPISPGQDLATGWTPRPLGLADGAPRSTDRHASPGPGNRSSSEHRASGLVRDRDLELFGARAPRTHRDREPGPPRRTGAPHLGRAGNFSLAQATVAPRSAARQESGLEPRTSSEARTLHLTGHRPPSLSGQGHRRLAGRDKRTVRPSLR